MTPLHRTGRPGIVWWTGACALILAACAGGAPSGGLPATPTAAGAPATATITPAPSPTATTTPSGGEPGAFGLVAGRCQARVFVRLRTGEEVSRIIGQTAGVSGTIDINPTDATQATIGPIRIEAASLSTGEAERDAALHSLILQVEQYPDIIFVPTALSGLPLSAAVGDEFTFEVQGDLTIRDVTRPVTFVAGLRVASADQIMGHAEATILRSDFGLTIPDLAATATVDDELRLKLNFVAERLR